MVAPVSPRTVSTAEKVEGIIISLYRYALAIGTEKFLPILPVVSISENFTIIFLLHTDKYKMDAATFTILEKLKLAKISCNTNVTSFGESNFFPHKI